ncbi:MAG: nitroreductase family protein [Candidatus Woesearchaeota archaeon]|nr:MAG: nitroreductase family protein [Candidatus Woesearchaeota archaeon]
MKVKEAIEKRRSIRAYTDRTIDKETINELLQAARLGPSAYNAQPWKFMIINQKETISKLKENNVFVQDFVYTAPLIIICCVSDEYPERAKEYVNTGKLSFGDMGLSSQNLVLRATELGIGSCYIGLLDRAKIKTILDIPQNYDVTYAIVLGYPAEDPDPKPRKELKDIVIGEL